MPTYLAPECSIELIQDAVFVDTNVWVNAFNEKSNDHDYALYFIENTQNTILVTLSVIAETWGMLQSKTKDIDKNRRTERAIAFLAWLADPGHNVRLIPEINDSVDYILDLAGSFGIDCADAMLAYLANHVNDTCGLNPFVAIASSDQRDFPPLRQHRNLKYQIYDVKQELSY